MMRSSILLELRRSWPISLIILLCCLSFCVDVFCVRFLGIDWSYEWLLVPELIATVWRELSSGVDPSVSPAEVLTLFTHSLFHADASHILYNMVFLWLFGQLAFRELGAVWVLAVFVVTAVAGGIAQVLLDPSSPIPVLGASGAVMGFEGLYLMLFIRWNLPDPDVWPLSHPVSPGRLVVFALAGLVFDLMGIAGQNQGVAFGAHIGGFIGGALIGSFVPRNSARLSGKGVG